MMPTAPSIQITDVLATRLTTVLASLCEERYGGPIVLERVADAGSPTTVRFRLRHADLPRLQADFTVQPVGGTVYDVHGTVEDGPSRTFTYCLPEAAPLVMPEAPHLAQEVASFLLDALERRLGSDLLRGVGRGRRTPSSPDHSVPRSPSPARSDVEPR